MDQYAALLQQTAQQNNEWSAQQAQKQMDFQREMSNTAHQREVADLKAAGLNPVLSAKLGGASTPTGAMGATDTGLTSALVDLLGLSMQTANSAAGAAYTSAAQNASGTLFDLPLIRNPRQPWQIVYNWVVGDEKVKEFYEDKLPSWALNLFGNPGSAEANGKGDYKLPSQYPFIGSEVDAITEAAPKSKKSTGEKAADAVATSASNFANWVYGLFGGPSTRRNEKK